MKVLFFFSAIILLAAGCATPPETADPDPVDIERDITVQPRDPGADDPETDRDAPDEAITDPRDLPSFEVVTYSSGDFNSDDVLRFNDFSRATVFASIIEALELADEMSAEQRRDLHDAIFRGVPRQGQGTFRAVAVSDYFTSGEPLYLLLGVNPPAGTVPDDTARTVFIQSSVLRDGDRIATRSYGRFVDMTVNISWVYHLGEDGIVRETSPAYTPRLAGRTLGEAMPHESQQERADDAQTDRTGQTDVPEQTDERDRTDRPDDTDLTDRTEQADDTDRTDGIHEADQPTLLELLDAAAMIDAPDVVPEEFVEEPPPVIDVSRPFTTETLAALERGAEPVDIPEAAAERVRLANRLVESAVSTESLNVPMLVDSLIRDSSAEPVVRVEAAFVRLLHAMLYEEESVVDEHAETLLSVREEVSSLPSRLAYRVDTIVPILLETYRYDTGDL